MLLQLLLQDVLPCRALVAGVEKYFLAAGRVNYTKIILSILMTGGGGVCGGYNKNIFLNINKIQNKFQMNLFNLFWYLFLHLNKVPQKNFS